VRDAVPIPVIASGGMGTLDDFVLAATEGGADAVAMADVLHYGRMTVAEIRAHAQAATLAVRSVG
jgi:cyclase